MRRSYRYTVLDRDDPPVHFEHAENRFSRLSVISCAMAATTLICLAVAVPLKFLTGTTVVIAMTVITSLVVAVTIIGLVLSLMSFYKRRRRKTRRLALLSGALNLATFAAFAVFMWWPSSTSLVIAAARGDFESVEQALELGVDVNTIADGGEIAGPQASALAAAAAHGHREVVLLLLTRGADVNLQTGSGLTPLFLAVRNGHREVVEDLLKDGANPDIGDEVSTPLHHAVLRGDGAMVRMLLAYDAKVNTDIGSALHPAAQRGHRTIVQLLLSEGANIDARDTNGNTPLHLAAANGHFPTVRLLLDEGAKPNLRNKADQTALEVAAHGHHDDIIRHLSALQPDMDIFTAIVLNRHEVVQTLLEKDPAVANTTRQGRTPLHDATQRGYLTISRLLLEAGAQVDARTADRYGRTPLHEAVLGDHKALVRMLLEAGANPNLTLKEGDTLAPPLYFAVVHQQPEIVQMLLDREADVNLMCTTPEADGPPLLFAVRNRSHEIAAMLLKHHADPSGRVNASSFTPMMEAIERGDIDMVRALLAAGADPNVGTPNYTPLALAEDNRSKQPIVYDNMINLLTFYGAK